MLSLKLSFKSAKDPANLYIFIVDDTLKEQQMKYQKIVQALDRILYLIWKQGISYQGVQKIAANSDTLWNPWNLNIATFYFMSTFVQHYKKTCSTWVNQVKMNWLALLQNAPFK